MKNSFILTGLLTLNLMLSSIGLASADARSWTQNGFSEVSVQLIESSTQASNRLPLTLVIDRDSQWSVEKVLILVRKAEQIFLQCDLQLSPITLVNAVHPQLADFSPTTDYLIAKDIPREQRPAIIFNEGSGGYVYANPEYYKDHDHEDLSRDTIFIDRLVYAMLSGEKLKNFEGVVVHELMHILLNEGHNRIPKNILNDKTQRGFDISPEQCERALKHYLVIKPG